MVKPLLRDYKTWSEEDRLGYVEYHCFGCKMFLDWRCDILGHVDGGAILACNAAGYRERNRPIPGGVRRLHNKQGRS
jgi:hypothetical protein